MIVLFASYALVSHASEKPNVIVVMVDDMGYGGVSCFDNKNFKTPELDRLCKDGLKLSSFYSNGSVCTPTRAALMTGRYQQRSGCDAVINADPDHPMHIRGLNDKEWTFPEAMKTAGYTTAIFGKWHLGYKAEFNPVKHGFDEFEGFISGNVDAHSHRDRESTQDWWRGEELKDRPGYLTDLLNDRAVDFIERNKENPFFMYIAHGSPHSPHQARGSKIVRGPDEGKLPSWAPEETYSDEPGSDDWLIRHFVLPVDEGIGRIRAKLEELGIAENTMIWFISDNGGTVKNQTQSVLTRGGKGSFHEGGIRVPGIVWAPGRIEAGNVSDEMILSFDIMPTSMRLAGIKSPADHKLDGRDVSPALLKGEKLPSVKRFWGMPDKLGMPDRRGAVRDGEWKLVVGRKHDELYNIKNDPKEMNDVSSQYPERVLQLLSFYETTLKDVNADSPYPSPQ